MSSLAFVAVLHRAHARAVLAGDALQERAGHFDRDRLGHQRVEHRLAVGLVLEVDRGGAPASALAGSPERPQREQLDLDTTCWLMTETNSLYTR